MENVLTSADLIKGHSDLVFADFREGHMTTVVDTRTFRYQCTQKFVPWSKVHKVRFQSSAVTLKKGSRSNERHVKKDLDKCVLCAN